MLRIGFIGQGSIARAALTALGPNVELCGYLMRAGRGDGALALDRLDDLLARRPDIIVECAGHEAVRLYGADILRAGVPLMVVSIGALADPAVEDMLSLASLYSGARLILPGGAIGGLDALKAARLGGLTRVTYRARKPAMAWQGSPAEAVVTLASLTEPATFFRGTAREAAMAFPKNSNVAATVALAGLGFDETQVELVADPHSARNLHEICFEGADGAFRFEIEGRPSPDNPKTSLLTAHSVASELIQFANAKARA